MIESASEASADPIESARSSILIWSFLKAERERERILGVVLTIRTCIETDQRALNDGTMMLLFRRRRHLLLALLCVIEHV